VSDTQVNSTSRPLRFSRKRELAARLGISTRTLDRAVRDGRLPRPTYVLGKALPLWNDEEVDRHLAEQSAAT
jgi:predicted DNA-binding transcriptional regulator AlpA